VVVPSRYAFPLVGGRTERRGNRNIFHPRSVLGTAFSIGGGAFLTAGHALANAVAHEAVHIGWVENSTKWISRQIDAHEIFHGFDVGVFRAQVHDAVDIPWHSEELPLLYPVRAIGHPNAAEVVAGRVGRMAHEGSIVTAQTADGRFPLLHAQPRIYLLSFRCPVGFSGAPLLTPDMQVVGIIVGNLAADLPVFREEETLKENGEERMLIQQEVAFYGAAVLASALTPLVSNLLKGSISDWLNAHEIRNE
jgi:hypothetical protein